MLTTDETKSDYNLYWVSVFFFSFAVVTGNTGSHKH